MSGCSSARQTLPRPPTSIAPLESSKPCRSPPAATTRLVGMEKSLALDWSRRGAKKSKGIPGINALAVPVKINKKRPLYPLEHRVDRTENRFFYLLHDEVTKPRTRETSNQSPNASPAQQLPHSQRTIATRTPPSHHPIPYNPAAASTTPRLI